MQTRGISRLLIAALMIVVPSQCLSQTDTKKASDAKSMLEKMVARYSALKTLRLTAVAYKEDKIVSKSVVTYASPNLLRIETAQGDKKKVVVYDGEKIGVMDEQGILLKRSAAESNVMLARAQAFTAADANYVSLIFLLSGHEMVLAAPEATRQMRFGATKILEGVPVREVIIDIKWDGDKGRIIYGIGARDYLLRYAVFTSAEDKTGRVKEIFTSVIADGEVAASTFEITPTYLPDALLPQK